jgi:hypothetical protein
MIHFPPPEETNKSRASEIPEHDHGKACRGHDRNAEASQARQAGALDDPAIPA